MGHVGVGWGVVGHAGVVWGGSCRGRDILKECQVRDTIIE